MDVYVLDSILAELTPHQLKIVQSLYDSGGSWMTRSQVARSLDKRRLTPYDINCLKMLTEQGIIMTSTQPTTAPGSDFAYIYTMPDDVAEVIAHWSDLKDEIREQEKSRQRKPINLID